MLRKTVILFTLLGSSLSLLVDTHAELVEPSIQFEDYSFGPLAFSLPTRTYEDNCNIEKLLGTSNVVVNGSRIRVKNSSGTLYISGLTKEAQQLNNFESLLNLERKDVTPYLAHLYKNCHKESELEVHPLFLEKEGLFEYIGTTFGYTSKFQNQDFEVKSKTNWITSLHVLTQLRDLDINSRIFLVRRNPKTPGELQFKQVSRVQTTKRVTSVIRGFSASQLEIEDDIAILEIPGVYPEARPQNQAIFGSNDVAYFELEFGRLAREKPYTRQDLELLSMPDQNLALSGTFGIGEVSFSTESRTTIEMLRLQQKRGSSGGPVYNKSGKIVALNICIKDSLKKNTERVLAIQLAGNLVFKNDYEESKKRDNWHEINDLTAAPLTWTYTKDCTPIGGRGGGDGRMDTEKENSNE